MKKQTSTIIALGAAVAVLGGGLIALKVTDKSDDTSSSSAAVQDTTNNGADLVLVEDSTAKSGSHTMEESHQHGVVKTVKVTNDSGSYKAVMESPAEGEKSAVYTIEGFEDLPVDKDMVSTLASNADNLTSASIVEENCSDFGKFGLADTAITVEIAYESGVAKKLYIGDVSPVSNQTYVRVDDDNTVYTITNGFAANYHCKAEEFISLTMLEEPPQESYPKVNSLRIERKDIDYDIFIEYDSTTDEKNSGGSSAKHVMKEPMEALLAVERSNVITNGMFGLAAKKVKAYHCSDSDVEAAGLKDPFCRATMKCDDGNDYVLLMSEPYTEDGAKLSNAMFEGSNVIYTVDTEKAQWATVKPVDIASRMMVSSFVWNVSELTAEADGVSEKFEISMKDSSMKTNEAKTEDVNVKRGGSDFDAERYRQFFSYLVNAYAEEFAINEPKPSGEPMAVIKIKDSFRNNETTFEFYDYSVMKSLIVVNGEPKFFSSKTYVDDLIENIRRIGSGEDFKNVS